MITSGTKQQRVDAAVEPVEPVAPSAPVALSPLDGSWAHQWDADGGAVVEALARERLRIAADVHDLIMQDLALALATARALADDTVPAPLANIVVAAAERALAGARSVLTDLSARDRRPVVEAVEGSVVAAARHVPLSFDAGGVPTGAQPDLPTLDALVHIGREAVTNAVKHAAPSAVEVVLQYADEWRLQVCDDGRGFDPGDRRAGFGLESMRRHAYALGGSLRVKSVAGVGTEVEVSLP
jgi:signal transduction histidine kinase